jgi:hypothetical protein
MRCDLCSTCLREEAQVVGLQPQLPTPAALGATTTHPSNPFAALPPTLTALTPSASRCSASLTSSLVL